MTYTRLPHSQRVRKMEPMTKRLIRGAIKTVAVIAVVVLFLGRMTNHAELLVSVGPVVVLVVCFALWRFFEDDDVNTGYWPPKLEKSVKTASALNATMPSMRRHGRTTQGHPSEPSTLIRYPLFLRVVLLFVSATVVAWRWMLPPLALGAAVALYLHFSRPQDSL
jgi:fatty acid desaturase